MDNKTISFAFIKNIFLQEKIKYSSLKEYQRLKKGIDHALEINHIEEGIMMKNNSFLQTITTLFPKGSNFDVKSKNGEPIFRYAQEQKKPWVISYFLEKMNDYSIFSQEEKNQLLIDSLSFPKSTLKLLKNGADPNYISLGKTKFLGVLEGVLGSIVSYSPDQIKEVLSYEPCIAHTIESILKKKQY